MSLSDSENRKPRLWPVAVLAVTAFAVLIGLGTWQVQRLQWKEGLLAEIDARTNGEPVPLGEAERRYDASGDVDYLPVRTAGTFDHLREQHFFATHKGASGYYIYTPLRLENDRVLFVNRGFVPFDRKDPNTRPDGQVDGVVAITGLARNPLSVKPSWAVPDNDLVAGVYYWKDIAAMAKASGVAEDELVPFFVDADTSPNPGGLPVGGVTIISLPNNHLQYAFTWYGLAAALAGVFGVWVWRRHRP